MPTIVLDLLKYAFLAMLYIFVWRAVRAIYVEMRGTARQPVPRGAPQPAPASARRPKQTPKKAVIVEGAQMKGQAFDLDDEITIGRSEKNRLRLEDSYVSQAHARIFPQGDKVMVEDMGSTNGTYVNRSRITAPTELVRGDKLKIGRTVMEMRK
jgi:hypothetical protein